MHRLLILLWFVHEKCKNNHSYHSFNVKKPRKKRFNSAFASWNKTWHHWTLHALYWVIPLTSFEFVASGVDLAHAHYTGISCSYMSLHVFLLLVAILAILIYADSFENSMWFHGLHGLPGAEFQTSEFISASSGETIYAALFDAAPSLQSLFKTARSASQDGQVEHGRTSRQNSQIC